MFIETFKSEGIAHLGYLVGDATQAVAIDPPRDVDGLLEAARRRGARVRFVLETHRNEDYVIGSTELARRTGASIHHGAHLDFGYGTPAREGDRFELGDVRLEVLETPGHTPESLSFVLYDTSTGDTPLAVFTGDALFVGDVGRTDLTGDAEDAARELYRSLHEKLLPLGDEVIVHPAHGAGSVCGEDMADRDVTTLGYERRHNPALQLDREGFLKKKASERHVLPPYFEEMEKLNLEGPPLVAPLPEPAALGPAELEAAIAGGARVVDVRSAEAFISAAVPNSLSLPLSVLSAYAGWFLPPDRDLLLVAENAEQMMRARTTLLRLGRARVQGWLATGFGAWVTSGRPLQTLGVVPPRRMGGRARERPEAIIDVRKITEWEAGHLPGSTHVFLGELPRHLGDGTLPDGRLVTMCGSGQRATVAASLLAAEGREVEVALGSIAALKDGETELSTGLTPY